MSIAVRLTKPPTSQRSNVNCNIQIIIYYAKPDGVGNIEISNYVDIRFLRNRFLPTKIFCQEFKQKIHPVRCGEY